MIAEKKEICPEMHATAITTNNADILTTEIADIANIAELSNREIQNPHRRNPRYRNFSDVHSLNISMIY